MDTMMTATRKSVNTLLDVKVQYRVPLYQRRYVWDESNWEVLWKNILDQEKSSENAKHFTGPIVTRLIRGQQSRYEVIDGQQRLMTFQIIFCIIRDLCECLGFCKLKGIAIRYLKNNDTTIDDFRSRDPDTLLPGPAYKFIPSEYDRLAFGEIRGYGEEGEDSERGYGKDIHKAYDENDKELRDDKVNEIRSQIFKDKKVSLNILGAYDYFYEEIRNYIEETSEAESYVEGSEEKRAKKISNLLDTIRFNFELVQITPGQSQRAEEVFESVNATGRKLSEFDYLRNSLFLRAGDDSERFYTGYWTFENDDDYDWNEDRLESFFQAFLIAKLGPDILEKGSKLFDVYQENLKEKNIKNEFRELKAYAETYKHLDNDNSNAHFKEQMQFYTDLSTFYDNKNDYNPGIRLLNYNNIILVQAFILHLVHKKGISYPKEQENLDQEELKQVFRVLESYTTRRLLMDTIIGRYAYQQIINYFRQISSGDLSNSEFSISKLVENLAEVKTRKWIPDVEIKNLFQNSRRRYIRIYSPYFQVGLRFTERYIFYRIENWMRKNDGKELLNFNEFPDKLERIQYGKDRNDSTRDSIGNTAFCKRGRDKNLISFENEREYLKRESGELLLNQVIYECLSEWGKNEITTREKSLLKGFREIWPSKDTLIIDISKPKVVAKPKVKPQPKIDISKPKVVAKPKVKPQPKWVSVIQLPCVIVSYQRQKLSKKVTFDDNSLFVCSLDAWRDLHPFIETVDDIRKRQLEPPQQRSERLHIEDELLKSARAEQAIASLVTRDRHLLEGTIEDIYDDVICMKIREHRVIVFRTGLLEFATDILYEGVVEDWGPDDLFGSIKCQSIPYIPVQNIEVKSEFLDQSIISRKLLPNVKVTFNLNIVQENGHSRFQALEVEPVTTGEVHEGTIELFRQQEGAGSITLNDNTEKIYLNKSQVPPEDRNLLTEGRHVEFNIAETVEGKNSAAINIRVIK